MCAPADNGYGGVISPPLKTAPHRITFTTSYALNLLLHLMVRVSRPKAPRAITITEVMNIERAAGQRARQDHRFIVCLRASEVLG